MMMIVEKDSINYMLENVWSLRSIEKRGKREASKEITSIIRKKT